MRPTLGHVATAAGFLFLLFAAAPCGATGLLKATFDNPTPAKLDNFGFSVAANDEFIFISANGDDDAAGPNSGAVYVYDAQDRSLLRTLTSPAPNANDLIGMYLETYEDLLLVGAWEEQEDSIYKSGAAYAFDPHTGEAIHRFVSPTPVEDDRFGRWLVGANGHILVGAYKDDIMGDKTGTTYAFDAETGLLSHMIFDPTPAVGDRFGYSLATMGDKVLVAAYRDSELALNSGGVFVYDAATGAYEQKILNPEPGRGDLFGRSIAVRGHYLAVGAADDSFHTDRDGSAYLIDILTGDTVAAFRNPSPDTLDEFGARITFIGDNVLVGAWRDDTNGEDAGAAYLFDGVTGALLHTFEDPVAAAANGFGFSLAAVGDDILISALGTSLPELKTGAAYLFDGSAFVAAPGDATHDGVVDAADYLRWSSHYLATEAMYEGEPLYSQADHQLVRGPADGDFNCDGVANGLDYLIWAANYAPASDTQVPEPSALALVGSAMLAGLWPRRRRVMR